MHSVCLECSPAKHVKESPHYHATCNKTNWFKYNASLTHHALHYATCTIIPYGYLICNCHSDSNDRLLNANTAFTFVMVLYCDCQDSATTRESPTEMTFTWCMREDDNVMCVYCIWNFFWKERVMLTELRWLHKYNVVGINLD